MARGDWQMMWTYDVATNRSVQRLVDKAKVTALILAILGYALRGEYYCCRSKNSVGPKNKGRSIFFGETTQESCCNNSGKAHSNQPPITCAFSSAHDMWRTAWVLDLGMSTNRSAQRMADKSKVTALIHAILGYALRGKYFCWFLSLVVPTILEWIFVYLARHVSAIGSS